jgi:predicted alpha/beta superfamily hydrolase
MSGSIIDRDKRILATSTTMGQTFFLCTINLYVGNNDHARPSQMTLANAMNSSVRSVRKWQHELESMGVLQVARAVSKQIGTHSTWITYLFLRWPMRHHVATERKRKNKSFFLMS